MMVFLGTIIGFIVIAMYLPIFKMASFGIVGDLFDVVPALTAEVRSAKS